MINLKKLILVIFLIIVFYVSLGHVSSLVIPEDALRIRVIANSNSEYDQNIKKIVKDDIQNKMYTLLKDTTNVFEAKQIISDNLDNIDNEINTILKSLNYNLSYDVNFGLNYFPSKEYKGIIYNEGYYESLVITLGEGKGDNWWCVLFPPLCLIEAEKSDEVEYTSFVKELLDKYL